MKYRFLIAFLFTCSLSYSQFLEDGIYLLSDGGLNQVRLTICEGGNNVCYFELIHDENTIAFTETGEWFRVNPNGVNPDYDGPMGWYQMSTFEGEYFELEMMESGSYKLIYGENSIELFTVGEPNSDG